MRIVVTGVPGVGKSTIMEGVAKEAKYRIVNFGDIMLEKARDIGVRNRDEIRKLPVERQRDLQRLAGEEIGRMDNVIVDTHMSIKTPAGFLPGLPEWVLRALRPSMLVLVEANPSSIVGRRRKDSTRYRDSDTEADIEMHQEMNRFFAASCATLTGATVVIIRNEEGKVNEAVEVLLGMIKNG
ncbi:MAG: adenylate kinase [Thermoplasmata archaeon]|jgi:adenylate kinase|nr:MAG: adenylate kinase [Aciduliprofundum sp.]HEU12862.1 adenylate kinase [Euryarchaeota archaeon]